MRLTRHGVALDDIDVVWVPGAWELGVVVRRLLSMDRYRRRRRARRSDSR